MKALFAIVFGLVMVALCGIPHWVAGSEIRFAGDPPVLASGPPVQREVQLVSTTTEIPITESDVTITESHEDVDILHCDGASCTGCNGCSAPGFWSVNAWLAHGVTFGEHDPSSGLNTPLTFNDFANDYQMNQLYISLQRPVSNCGFWDLGGRVDLLYGSDYFFTTAAGLETEDDGSPKWNSSDGPRGSGAARYGLALPQLYAEIFAPIGCGVNVKIGHFYTTLGYESVMAPDNFFYSHSYTMQYGEPFTHTGVLTEFQLSNFVTAHAGFTRGWDNWEDINGEGAFLGGLELTSPDQRSRLSLALHSGSEDDNGQNNRSTYSIVYTRHISPCLTYVLQHDFGSEANAEIDRNFNRDSAKWYGLTNYFLATINECSSFGLRVEWFRDQDNARVLGIPIEADVMGGNYVGISAGLNLKPRSFMTIRPELRWDWSDVEAVGLGQTGMFNDFTDDSQVTVAADMIIRF